MKVLRVRPEAPADVETIRAVHHAACGGGEPVEPGRVDALRADPGWLPGLSLAAVGDGEVVGNVGGRRSLDHVTVGDKSTIWVRGRSR